MPSPAPMNCRLSKFVPPFSEFQPLKPNLAVYTRPNQMTTSQMVWIGVDRRWIDDNREIEPWQWFGGAIAVEPRYFGGLIVGAMIQPWWFGTRPRVEWRLEQ